MMEIKSSSQLRNWVLLFYLYTAYPSNHYMATSFNTWQISCWHGPCFTTLQEHTSDTALKHFSKIYKWYTSTQRNRLKIMENLPSRLNAGCNKVNASSSQPYDTTKIAEFTNSIKFITIYCHARSKKIISLCNCWANLTNEILLFSQTFLDTRKLFMYPFLEI